MLNTKSGLLLIFQAMLLVVVCPFLTGCGFGKAKISGQVLFRGQPLAGGLVTFRPVDKKQNPVTARIDENGKYEATVPMGEVKISVDNRSVNATGGPVGVSGAAPPGVGSRGGPPRGAALGPPQD